MARVRLLGWAITVLLLSAATALSSDSREGGRVDARSPSTGRSDLVELAPTGELPIPRPPAVPPSAGSTPEPGPPPPEAPEPGAPAAAAPAAPAPAAPAPASRLMIARGQAPVEVPAGVARGHYTLSATFHGSGTRAQLTVGGGRAGEVGLAGQPRSLAAPVWIAGPGQTVGAISVAPPGGTATPVVVEGLRLEPAPSGYTTAGTSILDPNGHPYVPRGVNSFVLASAASGSHFNEPDIASMASWGATMVRVQLGEQLLLRGMCEYDPDYLTKIDERVRWITERGMLALLDLHRTTQGDPCGDHTALHEAPDRFAPEFWQIVADRYRHNPRVAFDLYNEPHDITPAIWRNGGTITESGLVGIPGRSWQAIGMQHLYDVVRASGARNLVFISGIDWAADLRPHATHPIDGWGIVAGVHSYCEDCKGQLPPRRDLMVGSAAAQLPVVVTEFGWAKDTGIYHQRAIDWAEGNGFGWLAHAWAPFPESTFGLLRDWAPAEPSAQGRPVRDALLSHR